MLKIPETLKKLELLDFDGKAEAFVEQKFLTPLLECLGYESHKDYEVIRHGDDNSSFKLKHPPVESGATKVKSYHPDYVPTIRKKMFWIIEAKSPKDVPHPFDLKYLIQGLQYCVHPEIQAKYLLLTNGKWSAVYDAHGAIFLDQDIYKPILEFQSSELLKRWEEIYNIFSVEKIRSTIERDLKSMYDKLCVSSLDKNYPRELLQIIGSSSANNARLIEKHVLKLNSDQMDKDGAEWKNAMNTEPADVIFLYMDFPIGLGKCAAQYFVEKSIDVGASITEVFSKLTDGYDGFTIFKKEQAFIGVCSLRWFAKDDHEKNKINKFLDEHYDAELPILTQVECAFLRYMRKVWVVSLYPALKIGVDHYLKHAPELEKFVRPPTPLSMTYEDEIEQHATIFQRLKKLEKEQLEKMLKTLLHVENDIEDKFKEARSKLSGSETQMGGFEGYGVGGKHYAFRNILTHFSITPEDLKNY